MKLVTRATWGGPATIGTAASVRKGIAIHYNGPATGLAGKAHADCTKYVQATHKYHRDTKGWAGIGYAWLVCPHGYVYEGRGFDRTQAAQPGGNSSHQSVQWMIGGTEKPTTEMLEAFYQLRDYLYGKGVAKDIRPHSSWIATSCPGDHMRKLITDGTLAKVKTAPKPPPPPPAKDDEPAHDYRKVTYGGKTVNVRTKVMLERARKLLTAYEWNPVLTQGSYNKGVGASAGTHDGGGVVDIRTSTMSVKGVGLCVQALRKAGFFAWARGYGGDGMSPHIHAVAIGDRELSPAAKSQVAQGFADKDGLARRGPDPAADPYPAWTRKYGRHVSPD